MRPIRLLAFVLCAVCGLSFADARADASDDAFYQGKTIRLVIGYSPGGGYDVYARMVAPYFKKYLGATIVVENRPGAGGLTALNGLAAARPDGLEIMLAKGNAAAMAQIVKEPAARYDLNNFGFLAGLGLSPDIWLIAPGLPIKSVAAAVGYDATIRWGASGPMDGLSDGANIVCEGLRLKCSVIMGYPGTNDVALAMARGEADALLTNESTASNFVRAGSALPLAAMAKTRSRFFPDLPTIFETKSLTPDQAWWFEFRAHTDAIGRIFLTTPGLPPGRLAALREGVRKALTDPQLIAEGAATQRFISYQSGEEMRDIASGVLSRVSDAEKVRIRDVAMATR